MNKALKTKQTIKEITNQLIREKGYASVTMNDVSKYSGISAGGLYYHYHSVEEIVCDMLVTEINNVWEELGNASNREEFLHAMEDYFRKEKKDMMNLESSLNEILHEYYFSFPSKLRQEMLQKAYVESISQMQEIFSKFIPDEMKREILCNHIQVVVHGLNFLAMSGVLKEETLDLEIEEVCNMIRKSIESAEDGKRE